MINFTTNQKVNQPSSSVNHSANTIHYHPQDFFGHQLLKDVHRRGFRNNCEKQRVVEITTKELEKIYGPQEDGFCVLFVQVKKGKDRLYEQIEFFKEGKSIRLK